MSGVGPDGMQSISSAARLGLERRHPLGHDARGLLGALQRRVPRTVERHAAEPLGDGGRLALAAFGERAVGQAVLGVLLLAVAHEVEVVGHGWTCDSPTGER